MFALTRTETSTVFTAVLDAFRDAASIVFDILPSTYKIVFATGDHSAALRKAFRDDQDNPVYGDCYAHVIRKVKEKTALLRNQVLTEFIFCKESVCITSFYIIDLSIQSIFC